MNLRTLFGISSCAVAGTLLVFGFVLTVLIALVISQLPFGQQQARQRMLGTPQPAPLPPLPSPDGKPVVSGSGHWCVVRACQETPQESHLNVGRVQGYVRDENGQPLAGVAAHVS